MQITLDQAKLYTNLQVCLVNITDSELVNRLYSIGIYPYSNLRIISKKVMFILDIKGSRFTLPKDIATKIIVKEF